MAKINHAIMHCFLSADMCLSPQSGSAGEYQLEMKNVFYHNPKPKLLYYDIICDFFTFLGLFITRG